MVKTVRVHLSDTIHEEWSKIKGSYTWEQVLIRGIEVIENFSDGKWKQALMETAEK